MAFIALFIGLAVALGGGVGFAAEQAEPGDALYTVKTHVNDEVRAMLNIETEAEVEATVDANADANSDINAAGGPNGAPVGGTYLDTDVQAGLDVGADALVR